MHVFCPDCNAEYKVKERSSLTKTVKFVCVECKKSWVDKFEKLEQIKNTVSGSQMAISNDVIETTKKELGTMELNSLALEEVENSFGYQKNTIVSENNKTEKEHTFQFETNELENKIGPEGPSKTFPKIKKSKEPDYDDHIEERDAKEIEIEKRLKESSELLRKAKQPYLENKEAIRKKNKPKKSKILVALSILLIVGFFAYNLTILFLDEIIREVPIALEILSQISSYTAFFKNILLTIIENIVNFIPTLA